MLNSKNSFEIMVTGPSPGCATAVGPRLTTTLFIQPPRYYDPILSTQMYKSPSYFIFLKTSLIRPPRYYDQDFMAQRWSL